MLNLYQNKPIFSLIISGCGREKHVGECSANLLAQTFPDFEIIYIAANMREAKAGISRLALKDPRLSIRQHNGGNACNEGLRHARGEYVLFMDAADLCEPDLLELVYGEILKAHGDIIFFNHDAPEDGPFKSVNFLAMACKKKFIYENRLFHQEIFTSDRIFFGMTALFLANKVSFIDKILVHPGSNSGSSFADAAKYLKTLYLVKNFIKEKVFHATFEGDCIAWMENKINKYKNILSAEERETLDILEKNYRILTLPN